MRALIFSFIVVYTLLMFGCGESAEERALREQGNVYINVMICDEKGFEMRKEIGKKGGNDHFRRSYVPAELKKPYGGVSTNVTEDDYVNDVTRKHYGLLSSLLEPRKPPYKMQIQIKEADGYWGKHNFYDDDFYFVSMDTDKYKVGSVREYYEKIKAKYGDTHPKWVELANPDTQPVIQTDRRTGKIYEGPTFPDSGRRVIMTYDDEGRRQVRKYLDRGGDGSEFAY